MNRPEMPMLSYDCRGAMNPPHGITSQDLADYSPRVDHARQEILEIDEQIWRDPAAIPGEKQPLDAGFVHLPERLLDAYAKDRNGSELGRILQVAAEVRETVDRVVVLGIGGSYMGAKALMDACCHPFHNELDRAARGSRPRIYFEGNNVDNDGMQGLLDLLGRRASTTPDDNWALVVISKSGGTLETAVAFRRFLAALEQASGNDRDLMARRVIPVTGETGKLRDLANALGCPQVFQVPEGVGGRFSVLSPVGLLPAAIMGLDVIKLLEGAVAMNDHFATRSLGENVVLDYTLVSYLMDALRGATIRVLSVWSKSLESLGLWYDQLLAESLGKQQLGSTPLTVVNTRDLHSRAQQHQEGRRDKLITNVIVDQWRRDPITVGRSEFNQDGLNDIADKNLPQIMSAAIAGTNDAYQSDDRPTADLHLPALNEASMGQIMQMLMLATVVEGRLMGINPYGQPGVEAYKQHMKRHLGL